MTKKFYNIEGIIRNGFKLSRNYEALDFNFTKLGDAGVAALAKSRVCPSTEAADHSGAETGTGKRKGHCRIGKPVESPISQVV